MAAVSRAVVCQDGDYRMTNKTNNSLTPVAHQPGRPPVRVKLRRINANFAKAYPPDGESKVWWKRLKKQSDLALMTIRSGRNAAFQDYRPSRRGLSEPARFDSPAVTPHEDP